MSWGGETCPNWIVLLHTCLDCVGDFCSDFSGVKTRRLPICYFVSQSLHICGNRHFVTHDQPICGNWNWPLWDKITHWSESATLSLFMCSKAKYLYYLYLRQSYGHNQQPFHYFCEANQANVLSLFVFVLSIFETKVHVSHNPQLQHFHYFCEQADVLSGRQKKVVWLPLQTFTPFIFLSLWRLMMGNRVLLELDSKYMRLNDWRPSHFEKSPCKENCAIL